MRMLMHVLKKNESENINNETISTKEIIDKLKEEVDEVIVAINNYNSNKTLLNLEEVMKETFDVIQVAILILWRFHRKAVDFDEPQLLKDVNIQHKDKLMSRGWTIETGIEIDIKE